MTTEKTMLSDIDDEIENEDAAVVDSGETAEKSEKSEKKIGRSRKKKKTRFFKPMLVMLVICFCVFAVADIVSQQAQIEQLRQETDAMAEKIDEAKKLNDEYTEMLNADESEFMEKVAVEQLGYAYPNERRFYIVNGSDN